MKIFWTSFVALGLSIMICTTIFNQTIIQDKNRLASECASQGDSSNAIECLAAPDSTNFPVQSFTYLNQKPPSLIPEIFAPGHISLADRGEFASVFSADGTEFIFGISDGTKTSILSTRLIGEVWSEPQAVVSHERFSYMDAFLSPDEMNLYYISNQPLDGNGETKDPDIWYSNRTETGWSVPQNAGPVLNSERGEYYISFTDDGTIYFTSNRAAAEDQQFNFDIHASSYQDGEFQTPVRLESSINSAGYDGDVYVAPDGSYLIFSSERPDGFGSGDLYVSFRTVEGGWTEAKNMGERINTDRQDYCPFVTRDGRYLFFSSKRDIYWVDASIIDTYR